MGNCTQSIKQCPRSRETSPRAGEFEWFQPPLAQVLQGNFGFADELPWVANGCGRSQ